MRLLIAIFVAFLGVACHAETLREFLAGAGVPPATRFTDQELAHLVHGGFAARDEVVFAAYLLADEEALTGAPHLLRYNPKSGQLLRREPPADDAIEQLGSLEEVQFLDEFVIFQFHLNPSAGTIVIVSQDLKPLGTYYGFSMEKIAPGTGVFEESIPHFAPAHPGRLSLVDLHTGRKAGLYPAKGDLMRTAFAHEHAKHMPAPDICQQANDPCDPALYDESITYLGSDGHGAFAIAVQRDAEHAKTADGEKESVAAEAALYLYAPSGNRWVYCEQPLAAEEAESLSGNRGQSYAEVKDRCIPGLPVEPEPANSDYGGTP